jgi:hypothetical protein
VSNKLKHLYKNQHELHYFIYRAMSTYRIAEKNAPRQPETTGGSVKILGDWVKTKKVARAMAKDTFP